VFSASLDGIASALEIIPIAFIWLIFFPPSIYQRWLERSDPQPKVAEG
jgi:hypothetical protein